MLRYSNRELLPIFEDMQKQLKLEQPTLADSVYTVPVSDYTDQGRWTEEVEQVFKRRPLALAFTRELPNPGDYRAMTIVGVPIIVVRNKAGGVSAYINACRHRGMKLVADGDGHASRFMCHYHAWTYASDDGKLVGVPEPEAFGAIDKSCYGLTQLPVEERSGFIWVVLTPGAPLDLDEWLGEMAPLLDKLGLEQFETYTSSILPGPNWKLAVEGYLETYHFATVHANSFVPLIHANRGLIHPFGRHHRLCTALRGTEDVIPAGDSDDWNPNIHVRHAYSIFPNMQMSFGTAAFGKDSVTRILVSQVFPGTGPDNSVSLLRIMSSRDVRGTSEEEDLKAFGDFVIRTVREEDYAATFEIQKTLHSGANDVLTIGRCEFGVQLLHKHLNDILRP